MLQRSRARSPRSRLVGPTVAVSIAVAVVLAGCGSSDADRAAESAAAASSAASVAAALSSSAASSAAAQASSSAASSSAASFAAAAASAAEASRSSAAQAAADAAASARAAATGAAAAAAESAGVGPPAATAEPAGKALTPEIAASVAAVATAAGSAPADPDLPGDEGGPRCKGSEQYADEQPIGMRADAAAAWTAVDTVAKAAGVNLCLADGKRSRKQQQQTYDDYVEQYGPEMAAQYVLPPEKSAHVLGLAVDVQPYAAYTWLEGTRGALGWCRIYDNEAWHFEYDAAYPAGGCPARLPHPTP